MLNCINNDQKQSMYIILIFVLIVLKTIYRLYEILRLNKNNDDYFVNKNYIFSKFNIENYSFSWLDVLNIAKFLNILLLSN